MLQQSIKHNNSIPRLFTATALTLGLLLACKKDVLQDYSEHSEHNNSSIAFLCKENNSFNTKATTGNDPDNSSSLKEVITLSECDSLYLILEEETMSTSQARTNLGMDNGMSKAAPTTTLNSTVGLFAYNHSSANIDASATQLADNHSINPMGGVLEEFSTSKVAFVWILLFLRISSILFFLLDAPFCCQSESEPYTLSSFASTYLFCPFRHRTASRFTLR